VEVDKPGSGVIDGVVAEGELVGKEEEVDAEEEEGLVVTGLDAVVEAELLDELDEGEMEAETELGAFVVTEGFEIPNVVKMFPLVVVDSAGLGVDGTGANSPSQSTFAGQSHVPNLGLAYPVPQT